MDVGVSGVYYGITDREKEDRKLIVQFSLVAAVDQAKSERTGQTEWMNREYITIHSPGDSTNIPHRPVEDKDRLRFKERYERWKRGQATGDLSGQPLTTWPGVTPADVNMLANAGIHSVEDLSALGDNQVGKEGGPVAFLRDRARRYIAASKSAAPVDSLNMKLDEAKGENEALKERLAAMERQMGALMARLTGDSGADATPVAAPSTPPKRRGRPPKAAVEARAE